MLFHLTSAKRKGEKETFLPIDSRGSWCEKEWQRNLSRRQVEPAKLIKWTTPKSAGFTRRQDVERRGYAAMANHVLSFAIQTGNNV